MITPGIRAFVARDWQAARSSKDAYWAARLSQSDLVPAFEAIARPPR